MGDFEKQIKKITGMEESEFIKVWKDRDREWTSGMKHIEVHGLKCLNMLNGKEQWDKELASKRTESGRPCLSENLLPDFVNKPHGEFCMSAPMAYVDPVDGEGDPKVADVLKGLIYSTAYQESGDAIHKDAFYYLVASSLTGWRVGTKFAEKDSFNIEPTMDLIVNAFNIRWDLTARKPDLSDKKWCILLDTMEKAEFIKEYGEEKWRPKDWGKTEGSQNDLWWSENKATVAEVLWVQEDKFMLYEHPEGHVSRERPATDVDKDGKKLRFRESSDKRVYSCIISGGEVLTEPTEWPDKTDEPIIPIIIVHGRKIVVAGKTYYKSIISDGLDIQQIHNYWITAVTEAIALQPDAPYLATIAQVDGIDEWTDLSKKTRVMRYKYDPKAPGPPQRQQPPQLSSAMMAMPQYTRQALRDVIGLQQASLGIASNEKSGVAIQRRKAEGDAGKFSFVENMQRGIALEAKILINIFPTIMDTPRIERVMGADGSRDLAYIKQQNPKTGDTIDLSVGKYDARVSIGPTFNSQRDEARALLSEVMQYLGSSVPQAVMAITPKFIKLLNAPDADEIARILIATLPPEIRALYQDESKTANIPPEVLAQVQSLGQQIQKADQIMQAQAKEIEGLKSDRDLKIKEIESRERMENSRLEVEKQRIDSSSTDKEKEINAKYSMLMEELSAKIELKMTELMETIKAQKELKSFQSSIEGKKGASIEEEGAAS